MCDRRRSIGNAVPCGYGRRCCRGRVGLVRCSRGCGRIGSAGPSVYLARQGLATMPGGMLDGPAFFKPLPPNHGSMGCYPAFASARESHYFLLPIDLDPFVPREGEKQPLFTIPLDRPTLPECRLRSWP